MVTDAQQDRKMKNKQSVVCDSGKRALIGTNPIQQNLIQKLCNATNIADIKDISK